MRSVERIKTIGKVSAVLLVIVLIVGSIVYAERRHTRKFEFWNVCQSLGGNTYSNADHKCVVVHTDGTLKVILTREQFEANLEEVK